MLSLPTAAQTSSLGHSRNRSTAPRFLALAVAAVLVPTALVVGASPVWATAPTVSSILPTSGPGGGGGTSVTITGADFCPSPTVTIGGTAATSVAFVSASSITAVTPAGTAGARDVVVDCGGAGSGTGTGLFTYIGAPTVTSLDVVAGSVAGGTAVTATGTGFTNGTVSSVTIGGIAATGVTVAGSTSLSFVTPVRTGTARKAGPFPVVVTTTLGGYSTGATTFLFRPLLGSVAQTVTNKALTSNVATITTSSAHGLLVNQTAYVTGVDSTFNGIHVVTGVPTTTTFTYDMTATNVTSAASSGTVGIGAPVPVTGVATTASATTTNNGLVILDNLAAASQRKAVTNTPTGGATDPSTRAGTYSAGTSVAAGTAYNYVTDQYYDPTTAAYGYESDERTISSNFTTTVNINDSYDSRTGVYGMTSRGNCNNAPNGSTTPATTNTKDGYETYCVVFGPQVFSEVFYATSDQALSFDWAAKGTSDDYEIYGYLVKVPSLTDVTATSSDHTIAAHGLGDTSVWTTESAAIPSNGYYQFRFVNGTYDATGGLLVGSNMFISPVVVVALANRITFPSISDKVAGSGTYTVPVSATSGTGVTVTSSTSTVCTVSTPSSGSPSTVTVTKGVSNGLCTLVASQGATGNYAPASTVSQSFQFLAAATAPQVTTGAASSITDTTVTLGGSVNPRGDAVTSVTFCVGTASDLTGCTSTTASPATIVATDPTTTVSAAISGLAAGTRYYYRITAINGVGTSTGSIANFTTSGTSGGGGGGSSGGGGSGGGGSSTPTTTPLDTPTSTPSTPTAPNLDLVVSPQTTSVPPGGSQVLIGGVPVSVTAGPAPGGKGTQLTGEGWTLGMGAVTTGGAKVPLNSQGQVAATTGQFVAVTGTGFAPGTLVQVFTVAPPISLGTLTVAADGSFSGRLRLPQTLAPGSAIIQVNGYSPTLSIRSASLGLLLKAAASTVRRSVVVYFAANSAKLSKAARSQISKIVASVPSKARNVAVQTVGYVQPTVSRSNDQSLSKARARNSFAANAAKLKNRFSKVQGISSGLGRATIKGPLGRKAIITISFTRP